MQGHPSCRSKPTRIAGITSQDRSRVTNWAAYDAALRARGSLTVWFTPEAVAAWAAAPRTTRGGQPSYSDLAIATALTLRAVFRLALGPSQSWGSGGHRHWRGGGVGWRGIFSPNR